MTVHAPQPPSPHPSLVPVSPISAVALFTLSAHSGSSQQMEEACGQVEVGGLAMRHRGVLG